MSGVCGDGRALVRPVAKAGGLGEVVFGLSREPELRGNAVEIVLPKYDSLRYDRIYGLTIACEDLCAVAQRRGPPHGVVWVRRGPQILLHRSPLGRPVL